jgi:REP element-mobilizing transposase RayT
MNAPNSIRWFRKHSRIVARDCWLDIPNHHPHVELDAFVVMPNHAHGILLFVGDPPIVATPASPRASRAHGPAPGSLAAVIGSYKSAVTRHINRLRPGAARGLWQDNYHEHVIRCDQARDRIREYIVSNPLRWARDAENPAGDGSDDVVMFTRSLIELDDVRSLRGGDAGVATTGAAACHPTRTSTQVSKVTRP